MIKKSLLFVFQLLLILGLVGGLHYAYLYANQIVVALEILAFCYAVNFVLALAIYITMLKLAADENKYLGFVFLFGSALKFAAYFLIFDPLFKADGVLNRVEFFMFFTPYLASLIAETVALVKLLRTEA